MGLFDNHDGGSSSHVCSTQSLAQSSSTTHSPCSSRCALTICRFYSNGDRRLHLLRSQQDRIGRFHCCHASYNPHSDDYARPKHAQVKRTSQVRQLLVLSYQMNADTGSANHRILKICFVIPVYSLYSFLSVCFPKAAVFLEPWQAFFMSLLLWDISSFS
jgi:hypothetical protein